MVGLTLLSSCGYVQRISPFVYALLDQVWPNILQNEGLVSAGCVADVKCLLAPNAVYVLGHIGIDTSTGRSVVMSTEGDGSIAGSVNDLLP